MNANPMPITMPMTRDAGALKELQRNARRVASLLKAMSNPARLIILCQIAEGERSVGELERAVGLSQSAISQHLAVLRGEAIVSSRRVRQTVLYSLASKEVVALITTLHAVFCRDVRAPKAASTRARRA
jgi:ArsR family transcriptional regulator, virulence genes transcriptional regulator